MPDDPARIVRFWHAVEMFSPQQLPKVDAKKHVADFRPGDPMPWEPGGKLRLARSGKVWRHVVFGGVYDLSKIRDVLVSKYGQDDPEAPTRGQSALFACTVDADGYLVEESAVLSACAWAIGQIIQGKPILTGFREDALHYAEDLRKLTGVTRILADSIRNSVPDAVSGGVTVAVTMALGRTLRRLICLCTDCHTTTHFGLARITGKSSEAFKHLCTVTEWPATQADQHIDAAFALWKTRSTITWGLDLSILSKAGIALTKPLPPLNARIWLAKFSAASNALSGELVTAASGSVKVRELLC
jgi:hypothetical protein